MVSSQPLLPRPSFVTMSVNIFQIALKVRRRLHRLRQMIPTKGFAFESGQLQRRLQTVSNLAPIHFLAGEFVQAALQLAKVDLLVPFLHHVEEILPDLSAGLTVERCIVQRYLDSRFEGFIECADAVGG